MAPVLDGEKRGWGIPVREVYEDEYGDDDEIQEELEQPCAEGGDLAVEEQWRDPGMYKSTNSILHDLHALHQHRLITSSSPMPSSSNPSSQQQQPSLSSSSLRPSSSKYIPPSYDNILTKSTLPPLSERLRILPFDHDLIVQRGLDRHAVGDMMPSGEERMVKERYEDTNRYILSLHSLAFFFVLSLLMKVF